MPFEIDGGYQLLYERIREQQKAQENWLVEQDKLWFRIGIGGVLGLGFWLAVWVLRK